MNIKKKISYLFVKNIYGDHNSKTNVKIAINNLIKEIPSDGSGLNVGAGNTFFDKRIKNLDIEKNNTIDIVGSVESIPIEKNKLDVIFCQEVLEHVKNPEIALSEMYRVLKPGGKLFLQVPFIIGYHPCPNDYWRFSDEGLKYIVLKNNFKIKHQEQTVGPATGFYRIAVEFFAILFSLPLPFLYKPLKGIFALLFYLVKYLDIIMIFSKESSRIAGGHFVICEKPKKKPFN